MRQNGIILVPVDLSEASEEALSLARGMARFYEARLVLLHVVDEVPAIWRLGWAAKRTEGVPTTAEIEARIEAWVSSLDMEGVAHETMVVAGGAGPEVVRVARELPADCVVLATHGNTGIQARFLGGTAYQVLRGVRCPVVSVKPPGFGATLMRMWDGIQLFGDKEESGDRLRRAAAFPPVALIHPTDFSEASQNATMLAARMAGRAGATLTVLHVGKGGQDDAADAWAREKMDQVRLQVEAMGSTVPRVAMRRGDPATEILREAVDSSADLIVLGSEGIGGLSVLSLGSTAARVVRQASCPVVTLRADTSLQEIDRAFRKVYASLSVASLRAPDEDEIRGMDDLMRSPAAEHFLGYYTRAGFVHALEEYGILQALRDKGYEDLRTSFDLSDPFEHLLRIHFGEVADREHLLIEVSLRPGAIEVPQGEGEGKRHGVLVALWLCMQHPRGQFSARKPPMPDQVYPGLGLGRQMLELLVLIAERLGKQALVNRPMHLHNARYYHHRFRYLDPKMEGRLAAILRDISDVSLADASWAVQLGCLMDANTGEPLRWEGKEQVLPMSDELREYFDSPEYRREVWATALEERYEIDWERFKERANEVP
jgi:nucleotide-binding universal stress UspA family protein